MREFAMPYAIGFMLAVFFTNVASSAESTALDRSVLPIPEPNYPHSQVLDARDATLRGESAGRRAQCAYRAD